ncbi:putative tRNA (guanine-N(1)-)-methyltransferase [Dictyocaulus viviparus]|uniref:Putative tRNA (Guanine-N(1)-)-methyltransferase n=1 Tax=Dictyocaulus viviparus TaxID=29172 RepID=A0A0D8XWC5_DICVI|nr:putative tRNA (guanine-N(1)-)-methyltransferase [Dictyocaulus viviparus]
MLQSLFLRISSRCIVRNDGFEQLYALSNPISSRQFFTTSETSQEVGNEGMEQNRDVDYEAQLKALMPSEEVWKVTPLRHHYKIKEMIKELEIYAYMGNFVPKSLSDENWFRRKIVYSLLNTTDSVAERVSFLEYLAIKQSRKERDQLKKNSKHNEYLALIEAQKHVFEQGGMGYGPELYQLIHNPMRNHKKIHLIQGARVLSALRCNDRPKIALDLQYMFKQKQRIRSVLGNQMQYIISENLESRTPFPISFVNFPITEDSQKWLHQCVGFYGGQYTHQTILPDFTEKGVKETYPEGEIVYISRHAVNVLDGPLNVDVVVLCISMDMERDSLGAARRSRIRAVRLPIQKYVKWQQGPMHLPFPNIMRILREVYQSGGDWRTALLNNISRRHLLSVEERQTEAELAKTNRRKIRLREKQELIRSIREATGHL